MINTIKIFAIKDPEGNFWKTPKGKSMWSSVGAAKNSWNKHNCAYKEDPPTSTGWVYKRYEHLNWAKDAEPNGWKIKKCRLVEDENP